MPDGPAYELELIGDILPKPEPALPSHLAENGRSVIHANKHYLAWGCIPVGQAEYVHYIVIMNI